MICFVLFNPVHLVRFTLAIMYFGIVPVVAFAQSSDRPIGEPYEEFVTGRVVQIVREADDDAFGMQRIVQDVIIEVEQGADAGRSFAIQNVILDDRDDMRMAEGERIVLRRIMKADGTVELVPAEKYRLPAVLWIVALFFVLVVLLSGWTGCRAIGGLLVSMFILAIILVPKIASGSNPILVSLLGSYAIACTSLTLAHGFSRRTFVALLSTLVTLSISAILSMLCVYGARLFGLGTEESMFLQSGLLENLNLRGLLLGGIIIGCLGVLDDVTTAQTAAVDEIRKANPSLSPAALWRAGVSVGREHIASLINTLALAYVGASLPLLLLFRTNGSDPLWMILNSEFIAEEIIRTLVGSATLLFAVPISTWCAVRFLKSVPGSANVHTHHHHF